MSIDAVGALQFVVVVGDVLAEIGRPAVGADDDAVFVVAVVGRAHPERAVFFVDEALGPQARDAGGDGAAFVQFAFALPADR